MNIFTRIVCITLLLTALIIVAFQVPIKSQSVQVNEVITNEAERISGDKFLHSTTTKKGVKIKAVKKPGNRMLQAIDKGFDELFAIAKKKPHNYKNQLKHSDYTIFIANPDRSQNATGKYSADIAIGSAQYQGTKYDQGGYIYVAGMVVAFNPSAFILANHKKDFARVSDIVRYEGEHLVLFHNDKKLFNKTADHSKGGGHPIIQ
jgi:hypothetical protein